MYLDYEHEQLIINSYKEIAILIDVISIINKIKRVI